MDIREGIFWYPFNRRPGGPQSPSGHGYKEKNSLLLLGIRPHLSSPYLNYPGSY